MEHMKVTLDEREVTVPKFVEDYEQVCQNLETISRRLLELLPDPSLGPEERLERVARIVPHTFVHSARTRTARVKLHDLRARLNELLPEHPEKSEHQKLEILVERINGMFPGENSTLFVKLEALGDQRISDTGR